MARAFEALTGKLRRFLDGRPSKRVAGPKRHSRPARSISYRPALEQLEERLAPAVDYASMATGLATQLNSLLDGANGVIDIVDYVNQATAALPILGSSLKSQVASVRTAVNQARDAVTPVLQALDGNAGQDAIRTALVNTGIVRDLDNNGLSTSDVLISNYDPANGNITLTIRMGKNLDLTTKNFKFNLGLPGVPFGLTGNAKLSVGLDVDYDRLSFGMRNGAFFVESPTGRANTLTVTVTANAQDANLIGTIGFFQIKGKAMPGLPAAQVSAGLVLNANGISLSSPRLVGSAAVNMNLDATLKSNSTGLTFPHMTTDFQMSWNLGGAHNVANRASWGSAPSVAFNNIQFGLGSFLGSMVKPIADVVKKITKPVDPIYELLAARIPGLSDLSEAAGLGTITLDKLAALAEAAKVLPPDYQLLATLGINLHTLVAIIRDAKFGAQNDVLIPVGSFNLSGNGDLRTKTLNGGYTTLKQWADAAINNPSLALNTLVPVATGALESIERKIETGNLPAPARNLVQNTFKHIKEQLRKLENGIGLTFPLLEDPLSVYKLLLGQDVDFARFDAKFEGSARQTEKLTVWGPVKAGFDGTIDLQTELHAGVDTFGLRTFFMDIASGRAADPSKLDDGFYVDSSKELAHITGAITAQAGVDVKFGLGAELFAFAGFSGQAGGNLVVSFVNPGNPKLRLLKTGEVGDTLFVVNGGFSAEFDFKVEVGVRVVIPNPIPGSDDIELFESRHQIYRKPIARVELFTAQDIDTRNPLNTPFPINNRIDVIYDVNFLNGANDDSFDTIVAEVRDSILYLWFNGINTDQYKLKNVNSLTIIGSDDDDEISVLGPLKPVFVDGGGGDDHLDLDDYNRVNTYNPIYQIGNNFVTRSRFLGSVFVTEKRIDYSNMESVFVGGSGARPNTFVIDAASVFTVVSGGEADDSFYLGSNSHTLDGLFNNLIIGGRGGLNRLYLNDREDDRRATYTINHEGLARSTFVSAYSPYLGREVTYTDSYQFLEFFDIGFMELRAADLGNSFIVDDFPDPREETPPSPMSIDLYTGAGWDNVSVLATTTTLDIFGQDGLDLVTVGAPVRGTRTIFGDVNISNAEGQTRLDVNDADTTTDRTIFMDTTTDRGFIYGLTGTALGGFGQSRIRYNVKESGGINVQTGSGSNNIGVGNTANGLVDGIFGWSLLRTKITTGAGANSINVMGTTGPLHIDSRSISTTISIGSSIIQESDLGRIRGVVVVGGVAGTLIFRDWANNAVTSYTMDETDFTRTNRQTGLTTNVSYFGLALSNMILTLGNGNSDLTINGTPTLGGFFPSINVNTGSGSDRVRVYGTNAPVNVDLGQGFYQTAVIGDETHSLDNIHAPVFVTGSGFIDAFVSNAASTRAQQTYIDAHHNLGHYQTVERTQSNGDGYDTLNTFTFRLFDPSRLSYTAGQAGDVTFVRGTLANVPTIVTGGAAQDTFWIEADQEPLLAPVYVFGDPADYDYAYYYDYFATTPQTYTFTAADGKQVVSRTGAADVTYSGLVQIIPYTGQFGGNNVNVHSVLGNLFLNMNVAKDDVVTLGNPTQLPESEIVGGDMSLILGAVSVTGGPNVTLVLDDTAGPQGRNATLHPSDDEYGESITGMAPGEVFWRLDDTSSVDILGGRFEDTFAIDGTSFKPAISIDGGSGINTLDYSNAVNLHGLVSWYRGESDFTDAFGANNGYGVNGAAFSGGEVGDAFLLDGIDDYVEIPNHSDLAPAALTLSAWVSPIDEDGSRVIMSKYDDSDPSGLNRSWALWYADGFVRFGVYQGSVGRVIQTNESVLIDGPWRHIAATFDPTTGDMQIYVDGRAETSHFVEGFDATVTAINNGSSPARIGALIDSNGLPSDFWSGRIDEARIYAKAISQAEVQASYDAGNAGTPAVGQGVRVHLPTGAASGLKGGVSRIHNVIGSAFDDILTGNGFNVLSGGAGRDILIAGRSQSTLNGDDGEDVLLGGFLYADDSDGELDPDALEAIAAEWSRRDVDYSTRSSTLQGMLSSPFFHNGGPNALYGQDDLDLFFLTDTDLADYTEEEVRVTS